MSSAENIMSTSIISVSPEQKIEEVVELLYNHNICALPVVNEKNQVSGIISALDIEKYCQEIHPVTVDELDKWSSPYNDTRLNRIEIAIDLLFSIVEYRLDRGVELLFNTKVEKVMDRNVITVKRDTEVEKIVNLMRKHKSSRVLVVDHNYYLEGIITRSNILSYLAHKMIAIKTKEGTLSKVIE